MARVVATDAQSQLNAKQRRSNVRGAFQLTRKIQSEYVVLIDDVVTTGSTVNELAKILKAAGVRRVDVWAIARTG
jgi:predicted amidophosphoribosyltransferase